jgi:uncharacterized protein (DUF433 family)
MPITAEPVPLTVDADGVIRVAGTRIGLDLIVETFLEGATAEDIAQQYPSLELADIYSVIAYYLRHRTEVDAYVRQRQQQAQEVKEEYERRFPPDGVRARLMARRNREKE